MNEPNPPPAWYPDPEVPGGWRWWTGREWSAHRGAAGFAFHADRALERASVRRTEFAILVRQFAVVATLFATPALGESTHRFLTRIGDLSNLQNLANGTSGVTLSVPDPALLDIGALVCLVAQIVLLVWQFRAARVARALGYPAHRSPGWGVASWFVPIVSLWMPAEALTDLLPVGDRLRRTLWWSWLGYVLAPLLSFAVFVLPAANRLPTAPIYHALVAAAVAANLAIAGFLVVFVRGVEANHAAAFGEV